MKRFGVYMLLILFCFGLAPPARAAEGVTIDSLSISCGSVVVTYTVSGSLGDESATLYVTSGSSTVGTASGPGSPDNTYTVTIPISPTLSPGTPVTTNVHVGAASDSSGSTPCSGTGGSGSQGNDGDENQPAPAPPWEGFSDGRLNPSPGEYYSVWCNFDRVDVWRAVPQSELLKLIPLADLIALNVGSSLDLGDFMIAVRNGEDGITIYGSNGNSAPEPGSKSFSLSECIERNGGPPDVPESEPSSGGEEPPGYTPPSGEDANAVCYELYGGSDGDAQLLLDCLEFNGGDVLSGLQELWLALFQLCLFGPAIVVGLPAGLWSWRRIRR